MKNEGKNGYWYAVNKDDPNWCKDGKSLFMKCSKCKAVVVREDWDKCLKCGSKNVEKE